MMSRSRRHGRDKREIRRERRSSPPALYRSVGSPVFRLSDAMHKLGRARGSISLQQQVLRCGMLWDAVVWSGPVWSCRSGIKPEILFLLHLPAVIPCRNLYLVGSLPTAKRWGPHLLHKHPRANRASRALALFSFPPLSFFSHPSWSLLSQPPTHHLPQVPLVEICLHMRSAGAILNQPTGKDNEGKRRARSRLATTIALVRVWGRPRQTILSPSEQVNGS